jgi:hypothetical protein
MLFAPSVLAQPPKSNTGVVDGLMADMESRWMLISQIIKIMALEVIRRKHRITGSKMDGLLVFNCLSRAPLLLFVMSH